jgi:hypothetical protein
MTKNDIIFIEYINKLYYSDKITTLINNNISKTILNISSLENFINDLKNNKLTIEHLSEFNYTDSFDHFLKLDYNKLINNKTKIKHVYDYLNTTDYIEKLNILSKINNVNIYKKYKKKGDKYDPNNYRFICNHSSELKLIDKIYMYKLINILPNNFINTDIYKASLIKNTINESCCTIAINNTLNIENVITLDIQKAFDSIEWHLLYNILIKFFSRYISKDLAIKLTNEYFLILLNRKFKFNKHLLNIKKGVSQGLASSSLIFTLFLQETLYDWSYNPKYMKVIIYIDDIYIKLLEMFDYVKVINELIELLENNLLIINKEKSKADKKLKLSFSTITEEDFYLGIPFTRNIKLYSALIIDQFNERNNVNLKLTNLHTILTIIEDINKTNDHNKYKKLIDKLTNFSLIIKKNKKNCELNKLIDKYNGNMTNILTKDINNFKFKIMGYLTYKLKPLSIYYNEKNILEFLQNYLIFNDLLNH